MALKEFSSLKTKERELPIQFAYLEHCWQTCIMHHAQAQENINNLTKQNIFPCCLHTQAPRAYSGTLVVRFFSLRRRP